MHLYGPQVGFLGSVPIVGASVPIAVGAALAAKMDGKGDVAVSYFGDGAVEEGSVQESLNLAAIMKLPVLFVCENNLFASHMHIRLRQVGDSTARFAQAHGIPATVVDGNDVVAVAAAAGEMIQRARSGEGPAYLEAVTYRWRGHVGPREDMDVGVKRSQDLVLWKGRDPIGRLAVALQMTGALSAERYARNAGRSQANGRRGVAARGGRIRSRRQRLCWIGCFPITEGQGNDHNTHDLRAGDPGWLPLSALILSRSLRIRPGVMEPLVRGHDDDRSGQGIRRRADH